VAALVAGPFVVTSWQSANQVDAAGGGAASCAGFGFYPSYYEDVYTSIGVRRQAGPVSLLFCALSLPHGKTVTSVKFQLFDESPAGGISGCYVSRVKLAPPDGSFQRLAGPLESGGSFADGYVVRTDTSIINAVIDNKKFAYFAECQAPGVMEMGVVGVSVFYS
jgi:hypothetical protein